jgi:hypothetical protein
MLPTVLHIPVFATPNSAAAKPESPSYHSPYTAPSRKLLADPPGPQQSGQHPPSSPHRASPLQMLPAACRFRLAHSPD